MGTETVTLQPVRNLSFFISPSTTTASAQLSVLSADRSMRTLSILLITPCGSKVRYMSHKEKFSKDAQFLGIK